MRIELTRRADGTTTLRCVRADGSVTWQNQRAPRHAAFFALHDLTHYAVETELAFREGFYGLVAAGWDVDDTTGKGKRGPLPPEALVVEQLVGALDRERASDAPWSASDFNTLLAQTTARERGGAPFALTEDDLSRVRAKVAELSARWAALGASETLALHFDDPPPVSPARR